MDFTTTYLNRFTSTLLLLILSVASIAQTVDINDRIREALWAQEELDSSYASEGHSPLTPQDLEDFTGLPFYPVDTNFMIFAKVIVTPDSPVFEMPTTTSRMPKYRQYALLEFTFGDSTYFLSAYQNLGLQNRPGFADYLFIPFADSTNGFGSYGGGRYLDARVPEGDTLYLDFNQCYNPYCAYNARYSCPKVPAENRLPIFIKAGVKAPEVHYE